MVSSINPFFALSYANIASLFGAAAASPSGVTATIAGSSSSSASISSTNDPAKAIQAILAKAQLDEAPAATSSGQSGVSAAVADAYAAQHTKAAPVGAASPFASEIYSSESSPAEPPDGSIYQSVKLNVSTFSSISNVHSETKTQDNFSLAVSVGDASIAADFSCEGLGQWKVNPDGSGAVYGSGNRNVHLQFGLNNGHVGIVESLNIEGLTSSQAQNIMNSFKEATSTINTRLLSSTGYGVEFEAEDDPCGPISASG